MYCFSVISVLVFGHDILVTFCDRT
jgi:hypothetical protein